MSRALDPDSIGALIQPLRSFHPVTSEEQLMSLYGRIMWSTVVEPGDGDAGLLAGMLGPESVFAIADNQTGEVIGALRQDGITADSEMLDLGKALERWLPRMDLERVATMCRAAAKIGLQFLSPEDREWPMQLNDLGVHAPQGLWVRGDIGVLRHTLGSVAIVGSRASTQYGNRLAGDLAAGAASLGAAIISGGAYGIDAQAHRATLASAGTTIAVLAGGGDRLYPAGNRELLTRIIAEGAIITEAPCGQAPTRWRFLQRNRLIAAISQATVVVEAGARSGALNTANHAMQLGRPLGAVPGPVTSSASVGCHRLIKEQHAELITDVSDLMSLRGETAGLFGDQELFWQERPTESVPVELADLAEVLKPELPPTAIRVFDALRPRKRLTIAELAALSGLSAADVRGGLTALQLSGLAETDATGWWKTSSLRSA